MSVEKLKSPISGSQAGGNNFLYKDMMAMNKIKPPFYISGTKLDENELKYHIYLQYHPKSTFASPCCNVDNCKIHSKSPRYWRTLNLLNYRAYIHLDLPKLTCPKCGKIVSYQVDWARPNCGLTHSFEQFVVALKDITTLSGASLMLGETVGRLSQTVRKLSKKEEK